MRRWDFVADTRLLSLLLFWWCGSVLTKPNTAAEHLWDMSDKHKQFPFAAQSPLMTLTGQNISGRCRETCCGCTACVVRPSLTPTHLFCLLDGWPRTGCPTVCTDRITFNSLHYSVEGSRADKFHVFELRGVTSVSLYLCTALSYCSPRIKTTNVQHYLPNNNRGWQL